MMNDAGKFDLGALNRVKSEIDVSLNRAAESLGEYRETSDSGKLAQCRSLTHQVRGALVMVGLEGPVQVAELLERIFVALEEGRLAVFSAESQVVIEQALAAIGQYLEDLMVGEPNQALRLLTVYRNLNGILASDVFRASDLFFPDLTIAPPERNELIDPLAGDELRVFLKRERLRFQKGLLALLRNPPGSAEAASGLEQMREALKAVEGTQEGTRPFWWVSRGFLDALSDQDIAVQKDAKRLCARVDLQIRRLIDGSPSLADRLMRDGLYFIARAKLAEDSLGNQVFSTFRLHELLPKSEIEPTTALKEKTLRQLRECVTAAEGFWNKFCAGQPTALAVFAEQARNCAVVTQRLGHAHVEKLGEGLGRIAAWLLEEPTRNSEGVAMEVATAILLLQSAHANYRHLGDDYALQVDRMVSRLDDCIAGALSTSDESVPVLDDVSRRAQERMLIVQVTREIQSSLAQIEQALDTFFRAPEEDFDGKPVQTALKQVRGALSMLGQERALASLEETSRRIERFSGAGYQAVHEDFVSVAHELSLIGLFVDALQNGPVDYEEFIRGIEAEALETEEEVPATVEVELAQKKEKTQALLEALKDAPDDQGIRNELKQNLQSLQIDADLLDDHALGESAKAALSALESGTQEGAELDHALAEALAPQTAEAPVPTAETMKLVQATEGELEAEFLEIFLEEATEVLSAMQCDLQKLRDDIHDREALTDIRRGTHTLKGSGRMVGLTSFGEFAWCIEQTLNVWVRQELEVTPAILDLIALCHATASAWVEELRNNSGNAPDISEVVALAERLRAEVAVGSE